MGCPFLDKLRLLRVYWGLETGKCVLSPGLKLINRRPTYVINLEISKCAQTNWVVVKIMVPFWVP